MRLWHYKLIPFLPKSQLIAQWRELNSIFKKQDKHILINYVYEYSKSHLYVYALMVVDEMMKRGVNKINFSNWDNYFENGKIANTWEVVDIEEIENPFIRHHNNRYLKQCFYNLQEKYDRGQKDFSKEQYFKLLEFVRGFDFGHDI